jgi:acyl carrier protein
MIELLIMEDKIQGFIERITFVEPGTIKPETQLFEQGIFDSMGLLNLISFLEEEFGVTTSDDELNEENFASVNSITRFVQQKSN